MNGFLLSLKIQALLTDYKPRLMLFTLSLNTFPRLLPENNNVIGKSVNAAIAETSIVTANNEPNLCNGTRLENINTANPAVTDTTFINIALPLIFIAERILSLIS